MPIASYREMRQNNIVGKTIFITDVPRETTSPYTIRNKTFIHCSIFGPAVLAPIHGNEFVGDFFRVPQSASNLVLENDSGFLMGMLALENCKFYECDFTFISFAGNSNVINRMLKTPIFNYAPERS